MSKLAELAKPFPVEEVKQRQGRGGKKLDYVDWTAVVRRLNDLYGMGWSEQLVSSSLDYNENTGTYVADVSLYLIIEGTSRIGTGAASGADPDDVYKTALAEALKKAGNHYGIALELWDEDHRDDLARQRQGDNLDDLKLKVVEIGEKLIGEALTDPAIQLTLLFDCTAKDLQSRTFLEAIVAEYAQA